MNEELRVGQVWYLRTVESKEINCWRITDLSKNTIAFVLHNKYSNYSRGRHLIRDIEFIELVEQ